MFCEFEKMRAPSLRTSATQQLGPIGRCPLYGTLYVPDTTWAADASAASTLPLFTFIVWRAVAESPSARICLKRLPLDGSVGISDHFTLSCACAWIAAHSSGATTPRKSFLRTTLAPGMWAIEPSSTDTGTASVPAPYAPCPRGRTIRPWSIPGMRMFWTYVYLPVTLSGMSTRGGLATPTSLYWLTGFVPGAPGDSPGPGDGTNAGVGRTSLAARPSLEPDPGDATT